MACYFKHCKILYAGSYGVIWQMLRHLHISVLHIIAVTHDVLGGCNKILLHNVKRFRRSLDTCFEPETNTVVFFWEKQKNKQKAYKEHRTWPRRVSSFSEIPWNLRLPGGSRWTASPPTTSLEEVGPGDWEKREPVIK